jgi:ABC-type transporter Mla subunit MlaD
MNPSPEARARRLFAGVLLALFLAVAAWLLLPSARYATYEIRSAEPVSGLIPGAPVEFHGVEVGKVREVELLQPRLVRVLVDVRRNIPVSSATVATITGRGLASRGFTGYVYVSLEEGDGRGTALAAAPGSDWPLLASAPARVVSLDTSIHQLNEDMRVVTALLQSALDPQTLRSLRQSAANLEQVAQLLANNNQRFAATLANAERASVQVQPLLQSSSEAMRTLRTQVLPQAHDSFVRLDALSASLDERLGVILRNTELASSRFEPLLQSGNDAVLSLQTQILPEAHRTLTRLDSLSSALGETAVRIRRNPALLLRGASPAADGPGEAQ